MSKLRIVIADDEALIRMDMREILEDAGHCVVGEAGNGEQAIKLTRAERPDLVVLDIKMPVLNGIDAAKAITDMGYPVLLISAFSQAEMIERAKKVGALNYLVKPVSEREVLPAVEMTYALHAKINSLRREVSSARTALAERKLIEKACNAYARHLGLTHDLAYGRMTKLAMNKSKPLYHVAKDILTILAQREKSVEQIAN